MNLSGIIFQFLYLAFNVSELLLEPGCRGL